MTINLEGQIFGRLVVTEKLQDRYYLCQCRCGSVTKVHYNNLRYRRVKSCGCGRLYYQALAVQYNQAAQLKRDVRNRAHSMRGKAHVALVDHNYGSQLQ